MWSKIAIFNQENDNSTEDLARFLKLLRSNKYYSDPTISNYIDVEYFQSLTPF